MRRASIAVAALVLLMTGCTASGSGSTKTAPAPRESTPAASSEILDDRGMAGRTVEEIIDELDTMPLGARPPDLMASVRPDGLVLSDGTAEETLPLPDDRFYLSVAPYVDSTHECFHHSLTTCTGELGGAEVELRVTTADGEVLLDETRTTYDNGFVGFWLPRDVEGTVDVKYDGRSGSAPFETRSDSATCLTTLRLV
jgi:hypothetical protein